MWTLILQSLPCHPVTFTVFLSIITSTKSRRPSVLTSTLVLNCIFPLICYFAAALHTSSFDLLCYSFSKCAFYFCYCSDIRSFDLIFRDISCFMYFVFFFDDDFFYCVNDFLKKFFSKFGHFSIGVLYFFLVFITVNRLMFFVFSANMDVLFGLFDQESSHDTSMVTFHVDRVVGLSVLLISQVSSLEEDVINLFFFSFSRVEGLFSFSTSLWTSCRARSNRLLSISFSISHLSCYFRLQCTCQHLCNPFLYQVPAQNWSLLRRSECTFY